MRLTQLAETDRLLREKRDELYILLDEDTKSGAETLHAFAEQVRVNGTCVADVVWFNAFAVTYLDQPLPTSSFTDAPTQLGVTLLLNTIDKVFEHADFIC